MLSLVDTQTKCPYNLIKHETKLENIHVNGREPVCALGLKMQMYQPRCTVFVNCCHYHSIIVKCLAHSKEVHYKITH